MLAFCACVNIYTSWLAFSVDPSSIRSTQVVFPRYLQRTFFQRLCVFFNMLQHCVLHSRQTKRFLRNNIAWGLYFRLHLCLLVWCRMPHEGINGKIFTVFRSMYAQLKSLTPHGLTDLCVCTVGTRQAVWSGHLFFASFINELDNMCNQLHCPSVFVDEEFPNFR